MCEMKSDATLIVENTYYSLLLYILYDESWRSRDYCVISERISPAFIERLRNYARTVWIYDYFPRLRLKQPLQSFMKRKEFIKKLNNYKIIAGNIFEIKISLAPDKLWMQIDDGDFTYNQLANDYRPDIPFVKIRNAYIFKKISAVEYNFDFSRAKYLLPDNEKYRHLSGKYNVVSINMHDRFQRLTEDKKADIFKLFGLNFNISNGQYLILMQPIYNDGLVKTINEEIILYKSMLRRLNLAESDCVLKPHPASRINYAQYFPTANIISHDFPSELLLLSGKKFSKAITLFSSGIHFFVDCADEIYFFGSLSLHLPVKQQPFKIINGQVTEFIVDEQ